MTEDTRTVTRERCENRTTYRAESGRIYRRWCPNPVAENARERVGVLGSLLCEKHAAERE